MLLVCILILYTLYYKCTYYTLYSYTIYTLFTHLLSLPTSTTAGRSQACLSSRWSYCPTCPRAPDCLWVSPSRPSYVCRMGGVYNSGSGGSTMLLLIIILLYQSTATSSTTTYILNYYHYYLLTLLLPLYCPGYRWDFDYVFFTESDQIVISRQLPMLYAHLKQYPGYGALYCSIVLCVYY